MSAVLAELRKEECVLMRFVSCFFALACGLLPAVLSAQDTSPVIGGPVAGYIFDSAAGNFRPILGIPGASTLGDPLDIPVSVSSAVISPGQDFALAAIGDGRSPAVLPLSGDLTAIVGIDGALPAPSRLFLSPSGTAAALYYEGQGTLRLITGLPSVPSVAGTIQIAALGSPPTSFAVSDDAAMVLLGLAQNGAGSVLLLRNDGSQQTVFTAGEVSALTFLAREDSAIVADHDNSAVYLLKNLAGSLETFAIGDAGDGLSAPMAVSVSGDNRQAFVLNSEGGGIVGLDLTGGPSRLLTCSCQPAHLDRLRGTSVYRLTDASSDPMWLLDGDSSAPHIVFVPPLHAGSQAGALAPEQNGGQL